MAAADLCRPLPSTRLGGTVRLVMLPKEAYGYRARESVMHMLWEMDQWLEQYVKSGERPSRPPSAGLSPGDH